MRISLIGYKDNSVNIFPGLGKVLSKKISGLELEERFVAFPEDLPIVALEASKESDFVFVFALLSDEDLVGVIRQKLIDVEVASKTRILKAVEVDDFPVMNEDAFLDKKEETINTYSALILNILFNEKVFAPIEPDFLGR